MNLLRFVIFNCKLTLQIPTTPELVFNHLKSQLVPPLTIKQRILGVSQKSFSGIIKDNHFDVKILRDFGTGGLGITRALGTLADKSNGTQLIVKFYNWELLINLLFGTVNIWFGIAARESNFGRLTVFVGLLFVLASYAIYYADIRKFKDVIRTIETK